MSAWVQISAAREWMEGEVESVAMLDTDGRECMRFEG